MRVISGKARGCKLASLEGLNTRPTTDRIKETLFNIINMDILDVKFLDICAGSGAIGIEALSRGASSCVFVEKNKDALEVVKKNLEHTKLIDDAKIVNDDAISYLENIDVSNKFDIIFIDPPYELKLYTKIIDIILKKNILNEDGIIIVEKDSKDELDEYKLNEIEVYRQKKFKTTTIDFIRLV